QNRPEKTPVCSADGGEVPAEKTQLELRSIKQEPPIRASTSRRSLFYCSTSAIIFSVATL
ncbi:MAG: hypothetical protein IJT16_03095, partial [Lachnospiraceae bacterium]|nr:hypothetical protein [Lachnospiraceae bacterium]